MLLLASFLIGIWLAQPAIATSPTTNESFINPPYGPNTPVNLSNPRKTLDTNTSSSRSISRWHSIRAEKQIDPEKLRAFLLSKGSPLADYSTQIASSAYASTIIGICWIEELKCTINPHGSNNFWGMMSKGKIIWYPTIEAGIEAINTFLAKAEAKHPTIESMRGWYCASACTTWEPTVLKIKQEVENL